MKWLTQVPVLGFNSGHYDLKLIRQYFIPLMARGKDVFAAEKNGRIMFINTPKFKFLDVVNYLAPGITYDKWVKTYGATLTKSWLPYEWFDSPAKLDFPGLSPYMAWYSKLKGEYVLTLKEYDDCHRVFRERGMRTFGDWLEYYNNLDVAPFLEALQKMKEFYTDLGVDIFKDAVSLPGVSEKYILRKTLQPRRGYKPPELYAPNAEAYAMLKAAVVGGPSLVFTRKHVAGETRICSHQYEDARLCRRILGYDANSLYPSTMMKEMPCGPGHITAYNNPEAAALVLPQLVGPSSGLGSRKWTSKSRESCGPISRSFLLSSSTVVSPTTWCPSICVTTCDRAGASASRSSRSSWGFCRRRRFSCTPPSWSGISTMG